MKQDDKRFLYAEMAFKDALIRLCQKKPAAEISVSELTKEAGYSRSAFYSHYENFDCFLETVLKREADKFADVHSYNYDLPLTTNISILEKTSIQTYAEVFTHIYNNRDLWKLILADKLMENSVEWMINYIIQNVLKRTERVADTYFENVDGSVWTLKDLYAPLDLNLIHYANYSACFALIQYWEKTGFRYSPEHLAVQRANSRHQFIPVIEKSKRR